MKKSFSLFGLSLLLLTQAMGQKGSFLGIGIKAGLNLGLVGNTSTVSSKSQTGFMVGLFKSPKYSKLLGWRIELVYSESAYDLKSDSATTTNKLDYISLANMLNVNITKYISVMVGAQFSYLLNAKSDSSSMSYGQFGQILNYMNRIDYGLTGGLEFHPFLGIVVGARYNLSFTSLYNSSSSQYSFYSGLGGSNLKNNSLQIFAGYRF